MTDWKKKYLDLSYKLNQVCVHKDILHKNCISLGRMECHLLLYLAAQENAICMNDLAFELNVSHSRITRVVDNLVKKDFVHRYPSEQDRRRWFAAITTAGKAMAKQSLEENLNLQEKLISRFPPADVEKIYTCLNLYIDALKTIIKEEEENNGA